MNGASHYCLRKFFVSKNFSYILGYSWVPFDRSMDLSLLVYAADDHDGYTMVVGRAHHCGDLIPGKVLLRHEVCHISYDGKEYSLPNFEVLVNSGGLSYTWVASSNGNVPENAVPGGKTGKF